MIDSIKEAWNDAKEENEQKRERKKKERENREEMGVTEGIIDSEKEYSKAQYKNRLGQIGSDAHEPEHEGRDREYEYKTILYSAHMGGTLNKLDVIINEDAKDGWRLVDRFESQDLGEGIKPGLILVFERPVKA